MGIEDILNNLYSEEGRLIDPPEWEIFAVEDKEIFARNHLTKEFWIWQEELYKLYEEKGHIT